MTSASGVTKDLRKLLAFGSGVGIELGATDLEIAVTRVRPTGIRVTGRHTIKDYTTRPAAEWGSEYSRFLRGLGARHLSATVLLPRRDVIVRQVSLPGVASKDVEGAIRFQLDTLHPYGDEEVCWGWSPLAYGAVLVGIARLNTVEKYAALFTGAGVGVSSFTFSAAAVHAAIRLNGHAENAGFVALSRSASGSVEVYGESASRPVFSAEFQISEQRAALLALSELRLPPDTAPMALEQVLPKPTVNPVENDLSRNALPYATALAGACPRLAPSANVLPVEKRKSSSRLVFVPTVVLAAIALLLAVGTVAYSKYAQQQYLKTLDGEIARLRPRAERADALSRQTDALRNRTRLLDQYRSQTRYDLDSINELTRLLEAPTWVSSLELTRDAVRITGETPQAAPLIKILDSSKFFKGSTPDVVVKAANGGDGFTIHATRSGRP
ncbi:MAG TPA: PilN domain-containing protein [Candidatus Limnocylindrales bacterium]|nr:PilN domain-containing protein [Candidatus Limnocylindrales bacterium]